MFPIDLETLISSNMKIPITKLKDKSSQHFIIV